MVSELENYLNRIESLRVLAAELLKAMPPEALNWVPTQEQEGSGSNSLAVLAAHIAGAEHFWIAEVIGQVPPTRDRKKEFACTAKDSSELIHLLELVSRETRGVFASLQNQDLSGTRLVDGREVVVRWAILHVIEHTALHYGHMQLTYQFWSGGKSIPSPSWQQRLPATR